jgi:hypothetical protein
MIMMISVFADCTCALPKELYDTNAFTKNHDFSELPRRKQRGIKKPKREKSFAASSGVLPEGNK